MNCRDWNRARVRLPGDALRSALSQSPGSRPRQICRSKPTHCLAGKAKAGRLAEAFPQHGRESVPRGRRGQSHPCALTSSKPPSLSEPPLILTWRSQGWGYGGGRVISELVG